MSEQTGLWGVMPLAPDVADVLSREQAMLDPLVRADPQLAGELLHEEFVEFGRSGRVWDRDSVLAMMAANPDIQSAHFDFVPMQISPDVVILTYLGTDGTRRTSTWVCQDGVWLLRFHQASVALEPQYTGPASQGYAIPILAITDADRSLAWYARLGFAEEWRHRFASGLPFYIGIVRPDGVRLHLSERAGDGRGSAVVALSVPDLDAALQSLGIPVVEGLPWGEDIEVQDPDGNVLRIGEAN